MMTMTYAQALEAVRAIYLDTDLSQRGWEAPHAIAGLGAEVFELAACETLIRSRQEAGDVLWYVCAVIDTFAIDPAAVVTAADDALTGEGVRTPWTLDHLAAAMGAAQRVARGDRRSLDRLEVALGRLVWAVVAVAGGQAHLPGVVDGLRSKLAGRKAAGTLRGDGEGVRA
jgi:hypothetical protein